MGAPQSRLYETAKGLTERGWEVKVVSAMPNYPTGKIFDAYRNRFSATDAIDGITVWRYWLYASNAKKSLPRIISMLSFSFTALFALFRIRSFRPHYIMTESPPLTLGLTGLFLSRVSGAKHILNVSDIWPLSAFELGALSKGFLYRRLEGLERYLYRNSFACTGQSQQIVDQLNRTGSRRAHLYRNGVDVERFEQARAGIEKAEHPRARIVYAGLLGVAQGIYDLCKNVDFAALGTELHIYGEGAEKNDIIRYLEQHPDKGIYLHASVKRHEVPAMLMQYDLTLIPLIKPIFGAIPSKIYEAMAAGLPIIFTGGGEGAELIARYKTGWICTPADYPQIEATIRQIGQLDPATLASIKVNCLDAARNVFNRSIQIDLLQSFLEQSL